MQSKAKSVEQYLNELPEDRREVISAVRDVIRQNLDPAYQEGMQYGMIGYFVPHEIYPQGYHCDPKQPVPYASLASQKNHMAVYLFCEYMEEDQSWFRQAWARTGKKLDMGKSCVRFKKLEDLALDVIGEAIRRNPVPIFVRRYEEAKAAMAARTTKGPPGRAATKATAKGTSARGTTKGTTKNKPAPKKPASRKSVARNASAIKRKSSKTSSTLPRRGSAAGSGRGGPATKKKVARKSTRKSS